MSFITNINLDYNRPIRIAEEVYWVGLYDPQTNSQANPYLIVDGEEGILIDGGSRSAFPSVMMKIMQTGITPASIVGLIYQNYDPRLCGSIPHFESIIDRTDLKIISAHANHMFIQHYSESANLLSLSDVRYEFRFSSGRKLRFIHIPYAHSAGSFITFDEKTEIIFTSDLFSGYTTDGWDLFLKLSPECKRCRGNANIERCAGAGRHCVIDDILRYHRQIMPSERALKLAIDRIADLPFSTIAPQHGRVIHEPDDILTICELLASLKGVGIDEIIGERSFYELGNINPIKERFKEP
jgi:flavorubredoxin